MSSQICKALSIVALAIAAAATPTPQGDDTYSETPVFRFTCSNKDTEEFCYGKAVCGALGETTEEVSSMWLILQKIILNFVRVALGRCGI
ncbi:hypothetical protein F4801DRAFT_575797 [Xylaria longipes]|nr:hypothetical protein F4801DRAFT_575797 [Xylaria longipes]